MHVTRERLEHTDHVLHPVPARYLDDERNPPMRRRPIANDFRSVPHPHFRRHAVDIDSPRRRRASTSCGPSSRFLGVKGSIEGGIVRSFAGSIQSGANEARENTCAPPARRTPHEGPGAVGPLVRPVVADVTAPHDVGAQLHQGRDEACRLRVVDDDDVSRSNPPEDGAEVRGERAFVDLAFPLPELPCLTRRAVEAVVDSLRHPEEVGSPVITSQSASSRFRARSRAASQASLRRRRRSPSS